MPKFKKQLPNDKKTTAEAKNHCRNVKRQLPNKQNTTAEELGSCNEKLKYEYDDTDIFENVTSKAMTI